MANAKTQLSEDAEGVSLYVTSELFGLTQPLRADLEVPSGVHLDRLVAELGLPKQHDHDGVMGVRYEYRLVHDDVPLSRAKSLVDQGVQRGAVLWLEVEIKPYAKGQAVQGQLAGARFRDDGTGGTVTRAARRALLDAVAAAGLGA